ncbi:hypothetical protein AAVH_24426 [Aphelenchoides avenae]|nr:hypothetical protein AAVH_24426 [Aphelenchus avenae]
MWSHFKSLAANSVKQSGGIKSELAINAPLKDFLYQGDLVLTEAQALQLNFTGGLKQRRAGHTVAHDDGALQVLPTWPHDTPICYRFKEGGCMLRTLF